MLGSPGCRRDGFSFFRGIVVAAATCIALALHPAVARAQYVPVGDLAPTGRPQPRDGTSRNEHPEIDAPSEVRIARMRASFGLSVAPLLLADSEYGHAANLWGYTSFHVCGQYALHGGGHAVGALRLGARVGYTACDGGTAFADGARLRLSAVDVSFQVALLHSIIVRGLFGAQVGAVFELGGQWTELQLRAQAGSAWLLRGAAALRGALLFGPVALGISAGGQHASWPDVAGGGTTLTLFGFLAAGFLELWL